MEEDDENAWSVSRCLVSHHLAAREVRVCARPDDAAVRFQAAFDHHDRMRRGVPVQAPLHASGVTDQVVLLARLRIRMQKSEADFLIVDGSRIRAWLLQLQ